MSDFTWRHTHSGNPNFLPFCGVDQEELDAGDRIRDAILGNTSRESREHIYVLTPVLALSSNKHEGDKEGGE